MDEKDVEAVASAFLAGEPYEALTWFLSVIASEKTSVPNDAIVSAFNLLDDEDKEEYVGLLA